MLMGDVQGIVRLIKYRDRQALLHIPLMWTDQDKLYIRD